MKQLEREVKRRSHLRSRPSYTLPPSSQRTNKEEEKHKPPFKALTDLLFQTAVLGINTTAKVTKPTLAHVILPLFRDLWELYIPNRIQTWMKVLPSTLSNVNNLLWDTKSGVVLGNKLNILLEDVMDLSSSNAARQCVIDFTVGIIKFIEAMHTPEVKALLDQSALSIVRFVDIWSSGKARQLWLDLSDTIWALIEVGSDPLVVMTLAEGCAQICFALEEERAELKKWKKKECAAKRRKERDVRQMEMYPPDGEVVSGREGVEKALVNTLANDGANPELETIDALKSGPPSVIIQNTQLHNGSNGQDETVQTPQLDPIDSVDQDGESEITTDEIEDLQLRDKPSHDSDNWIKLDSGRQQLEYERGDGDSSRGDLATHQNQFDSDDDNARDSYDVFQESILQFQKRLDEVLKETRKGSKSSSVIENNILKKRTLRNGNRSQMQSRTDEPVTTTSFTNIHRPLVVNRWKIFITIAICSVVMLMVAWFALGCYGFYVIILGGSKSHHINSKTMPQNFDDTIAHTQPVIIQVIVGQNKETGRKFRSASNIGSLSLSEWSKMNRDVERAIMQQIDGKMDL